MCAEKNNGIHVWWKLHYRDVIMGAKVSHLFTYRWLVNSPHKGPVTRKMFPFDDVIMCYLYFGLQLIAQVTLTVRHVWLRMHVHTVLPVTRRLMEDAQVMGDVGELDGEGFLNQNQRIIFRQMSKKSLHGLRQWTASDFVHRCSEYLNGL